LRSFGSFAEAISISIDPRGMIYVVDKKMNTVKKFSSTGDSLAQVGGYGWSDETLQQPTDVVAPNGLDVYVADYANHRIQRYDNNLNFVSTLASKGGKVASVSFGYPRSVAVSGLGSLFILDNENIRIIKISVDKSIERIFGGLEAGKGRLRSPTRVRVDSDENVYVLDGKRLVVFDPFGNYLKIIADSIFSNPQNFNIYQDTLYVIDCDVIIVLSKNGEILREINIVAQSGSDSYSVDLAVYQRKLYILTLHGIHVLDLE
jgi:sugar lactone lactonase YvrE